MSTCAACGQANPEQARFCLACGTALTPPAPPVEERKVVTALFTDIVGSTASAEELDPEDVRARLAPYYARLRRELERYGGTVEKFIGDAVVALFGAPVAHEDDPERAVRAALAINRAIAELNAEDAWLDLHVRTAVHTGEALVVVGARVSEGEGMAAGDVMNTAARLQSKAPPDGVVVGEATYRATADRFEFRQTDPIEAKGKSKPIPAWILVGEKATPVRPGKRTPLVGRQAELAALHEAWETVLRSRRGGAVTVVGPPGVGKTRLLLAFCEQVEQAADTYWGRCLSYGEGITYWPLTEIVRAAAGVLQSDDQATSSLKLGELLERLPTDDDDELRTMASALANLVGAPTTPRGTYEAGEISQAELHWGVRRVLELLAESRPLVVVCEDLHWAEPTLLELLQSIAVGDVRAPILLLGSARPELAEARPAGLAATASEIVVEPLDDRDGEALVAELVGDAAVAPSLLAHLLRTAAGNPLFLEETVRMLAEADALDASEGAVRVPDTLQSLIGSRLDLLPLEQKRTAEHAAVVGHVFWLGAVSRLLERDGDLIGELDALARRDVVRTHEQSTVAGDREYAFKHILVRDVAYDRLPKGRRAELHVRFSAWLAELPGGEDEFVEIRAHHLEQACRLARAVAHSPVAPPVVAAVDALRRSGEKAERREGIREADRFYERALEVVGGEDPELALELRLQRCRTLTALGDLRRATEQLQAVATDAVTVARADLRCAALLGLANIDGKQGRSTEARARLGEAEGLAFGVGEPRLQIRALFESAHLRAWFGGEGEAAAEELTRALALAEALGDRALRMEGHMRLGATLFNIGRLAEAEAQLERCTALASETGSFRDDARATSMLSLYRYYRGRVDEAERLALQARDWLEITCDSHLQLQNFRDLAKYALSRGDARLAEERLRQALPLAVEAGGWLLLEVYRYLVEALVRQGRVEDASELAAFAARNLPEEDVYARAALLVAEALVAAQTGERATASAAFAEALRLLEQQQLQIDLVETRIAFAQALRSFGEDAGARVELERARATSARMEARGLVEQIDRELSGMAKGADSVGPLA